MPDCLTTHTSLIMHGGGSVRKLLVSVKFVSAILGPEMAAPFLWAPRISAFFLQEKTSMSIKFLIFGGGACIFGFGGGKCRFYFMGAGIFPHPFNYARGGGGSPPC